MNDSTLIGPGHVTRARGHVTILAQSLLRRIADWQLYFLRGEAPAKMNARGACELFFSWQIFNLRRVAGAG